jgi:uncharacterized membrane protein YgcG
MLHWGLEAKGSVRLGEDRAYLRQMGVWFGLVAVRPKPEEVLAQEKTAGLDSECVLERVGGGDDVVERTLGAEVQLFREEDQEWMRYGVITKQAEWVAEHVVGMGRRKGQWLQVVVRGMQRTCAAMERRFQGAIQLWLQYRGVMAGAEVGQVGAYPCSCCKQWYTTVWVLGETGGRDAPAHMLQCRAKAGRQLQRTHLRQPQASWDTLPVKTCVRVPAGAWFEEEDDTSKGAVLRGHVRRVVDAASVPNMVVAGVPNKRVVEVEFTEKEPHVQRVALAGGQSELRLVGKRATPGCMRWMPASEASLYEEVRRPYEARIKEKRQVQERRLMGEQLVSAMSGGQEANSCGSADSSGGSNGSAVVVDLSRGSNGPADRSSSSDDGSSGSGGSSMAASCNVGGGSGTGGGGNSTTSNRGDNMGGSSNSAASSGSDGSEAGGGSSTW